MKYHPHVNFKLKDITNGLYKVKNHVKNCQGKIVVCAL